MTQTPPPVFESIRQTALHADLAQLLDWTHTLILWRQEQGSELTEQSAFQPLAISSIRLNLGRLEETPIAGFLRLKLQKTLLAIACSESSVQQDQALVGISFVLGTIVDMLDNPETPFELASMVYESQTMFDEWYDQLLAMAGLRPRQ